jgi:hypothetical protein
VDSGALEVLISEKKKERERLQMILLCYNTLKCMTLGEQAAKSTTGFNVVLK